MKKSNKISVFYFLSSIALLSFLVFGGVYGIYVSVGLNFVKGNTVNALDNVGKASSVSFGGSVNFESSMSGVIILSIALVILAVFDIVVLFKQIVFFKQFKAVKESTIEQIIERKIKSKKSVIVFAFVIDILSFIAGFLGIFLNVRTFIGMNNIWLLYIVDGFVIIFSLISFVLLIMKLKGIKKNKQIVSFQENGNKIKTNEIFLNKDNSKQYIYDVDIDKIEYSLLKLRYLKSSKMIADKEFEMLRAKILNLNNEENLSKEK